jgi:uncharacterized iron-regulated membrane protein
MIRHVWVLFHRWVGLAIAGFLFVSGLTGAVISWDHELDDLLNAHLFETNTRGPYIPALELAERIELRDPRAQVTFVPMTPEPGEALVFGVSPRVDSKTGELYDLGYNELFIDPVTAVEQGRRDWGAPWPITSENFVSFLYVLHYSLHIPEMWGIDHWGMWLLGGIAMLWTLDSFVGFYLTLPIRRRLAPDQPAAVRKQVAQGWWSRWKPAWKIKTTGSAYRINFDIHRAFSLWTWGMLFMLGFTSFSLNLYSEVFYPVMSLVSEVTPTPFDVREPAPLHQPIEPKIGYAEIIERAAAEGQRRGWDEPVGSVFYANDYGVYGVSFYYPGDDHGAAGVGPSILYYDSNDGSLIGNWLPWQGTAADIFVQAQFPLHSGRILGVPGRILVSIMGLVVATLSVTGVVIWWRKRAARERRDHVAAERRHAVAQRPANQSAE